MHRAFNLADRRSTPKAIERLEGAPSRRAEKELAPGNFGPGPVRVQEKVRVTVVSAFHPG